MSLETTITNAWQRQARWLWLLLPISWLYGLLITMRHQAYKAGLFSSYRAPIPVMVIGNITVGGSGKTPLIMALVQYLQQHKVQVGVISRGYGGDSSQMPALVTTHSLPSLVGDEPSLIVNMTGVAMAVCPNRKQAIKTLLAAHPNLQLIIADDGLQHYALQRDIEWIVVDVARGFGNRQLLPTGFLREPMTRLQETSVIYHEKLDNIANDYTLDTNPRLTMQLIPDTLQKLWSPALLSTNHLPTQHLPTQHLPTQYATFKAQISSAIPIAGQVHAVSGIGYPQRFFATLEGLGFEVIAHPYPDHYDFELTDLVQYKQYPIIVTSKDAVKIRALIAKNLNNANEAVDRDTVIFDSVQHNTTEPPLTKSVQQAELKELIARLWVLPVTAELSTACYAKLNLQLQALGIQLEYS